MIAIVSPAKSLDFESKPTYDFSTKPVFSEEANYLAKKLESLSKKKLKSLMSISDNLTELNYQRYKNWNFNGSTTNKKQAIYAFTGDVYRGFDVDQLNKADVEYAQNHFRILSGMYGVLKPMDLMQPYRLEMGTKWQITKAKSNLYDYWGKKITEQLNEDLKGFTPKVLVNLASNEYFKAVQPEHFDGDIVDIAFKDEKNGEYKIIAIYAKVARGAFARFMIKSRASSIDDLKLFKEDGYAFDANLSSEKELVFTR